MPIRLVPAFLVLDLRRQEVAMPSVSMTQPCPCACWSKQRNVADGSRNRN